MDFTNNSRVQEGHYETSLINSTWICGRCHEENGSKRSVCTSCGNPRPVEHGETTETAVTNGDNTQTVEQGERPQVSSVPPAPQQPGYRQERGYRRPPQRRNVKQESSTFRNVLIGVLILLGIGAVILGVTLLLKKKSPPQQPAVKPGNNGNHKPSVTKPKPGAAKPGPAKPSDTPDKSESEEPSGCVDACTKKSTKWFNWGWEKLSDKIMNMTQEEWTKVIGWLFTARFAYSIFRRLKSDPPQADDSCLGWIFYSARKYFLPMPGIDRNSKISCWSCLCAAFMWHNSYKRFERWGRQYGCLSPKPKSPSAAGPAAPRPGPEAVHPPPPQGNPPRAARAA